jgi:hypothetical protein
VVVASPAFLIMTKDQKIVFLTEQVQQQQQFIDDLFSKSKPVADEMNDIKNVFFKIFKFIKLAFQLVMIILSAYDKKPDPIDFFKF